MIILKQMITIMIVNILLMVKSWRAASLPRLLLLLPASRAGSARVVSSGRDPDQAATLCRICRRFEKYFSQIFFGFLFKVTTHVFSEWVKRRSGGELNLAGCDVPQKVFLANTFLYLLTVTTMVCSEQLLVGGDLSLQGKWDFVNKA